MRVNEAPALCVSPHGRDDEGVRRSLQFLLHWRGYDVRSFASAASLLGSEEAGNAEILVADYRLPDGNGIDVLRHLRGRGWRGRSILITAFPTPELVQQAEASGFDAVLDKPLRQQSLLALLGS